MCTPVSALTSFAARRAGIDSLPLGATTTSPVGAAVICSLAARASIKAGEERARTSARPSRAARAAEGSLFPRWPTVRVIIRSGPGGPAPSAHGRPPVGRATCYPLLLPRRSMTTARLTENPVRRISPRSWCTLATRTGRHHRLPDDVSGCRATRRACGCSATCDRRSLERRPAASTSSGRSSSSGNSLGDRRTESSTSAALSPDSDLAVIWPRCA
jgi:hypothetical protein